MKNKVIIIIALLCFLGYSIKAQNPLVQNLLNDVKLDSLVNFVKQLSGERSVVINGVTDTIKSRHYQSPGNEKAFQFMKQEFIRFGYQIDSFQFNPSGKNLFAIKTGYKYPNRRFMLGAHYDNWPATQIAPGADDNASGSASVLEAGRIFSTYNFPYTIVFALWDEEEPGLIGSTAYVPTIGSDNDTLMGYVNVDMLGWDSNNDSVADLNVRPVANSLSLSSRAQWCNIAYNIKLGLHIVNPGNGSTDHAPFWDNNHTAIGIDEEYDNDFNAYWHTPADSIGQFRLSFYQKCAKLAYATIADCAIDIVNTVSISEYSKDLELKIYPNPFIDKISVNSHTLGDLVERIIFFDGAGQIMYDEKINKRYTEVTVPNNLQSGFYFLQVFTANTSFTKKVIKQ